MSVTSATISGTAVSFRERLLCYLGSVTSATVEGAATEFRAPPTLCRVGQLSFGRVYNGFGRIYFELGASAPIRVRLLCSWKVYNVFERVYLVSG